MADDDLKLLSKRLKELGEKGLSRELNKGINAAVLPLKKELPKSARKILPGRGGLAERIATSKISIRKLPNGVVLTMKNKYQIAKMDIPGVIRHPVFPRRSNVQKKILHQKGPAKLHKSRAKWAWESQKIRPGWFSEPTAKSGRQAAKDVEAAIVRVAKQIAGR